MGWYGNGSLDLHADWRDDVEIVIPTYPETGGSWTGTPASTPNALGNAFVGDGAAFFRFSGGPNFPLTPFSIFCVHSGATYSQGFILGNRHPSLSTAGLAFRLRDPSGGLFRIQMLNLGGANVETGRIVNQTDTFSYTSFSIDASNDYQFWYNGTLVLSGNLAINTSGGDMEFGAVGRGADGAIMAHNMQHVMLFRTALSTAQHEALHADPTMVYAGVGTTLITTDVNALLQKQITITSTVNAQLAKNIATTLDVDAVLAKGRILITDIDGYLQQRVLLTTDADAILGGLSTIVTQVDAYLQHSVSVLTDIDALLAAPQTVQTTADSILQLRNEVTTSLDALLSKTQGVVTAVDAVLIEAGVTIITTEVNALLSRMRNIIVTSDALLRKGFQAQTTIDSILQTRSTITALINAVFRKTQMITLLADSVLFDTDALGFQGTAGGFNLSQPSVNFGAARSVSFGASRSFILDNPRGFRRSS